MFIPNTNIGIARSEPLQPNEYQLKRFKTLMYAARSSLHISTDHGKQQQQRHLKSFALLLVLFYVARTRSSGNCDVFHLATR